MHVKCLRILVMRISIKTRCRLAITVLNVFFWDGNQANLQLSTETYLYLSQTVVYRAYSCDPFWTLLNSARICQENCSMTGNRTEILTGLWQFGTAYRISLSWSRTVYFRICQEIEQSVSWPRIASVRISVVTLVKEHFIFYFLTDADTI